MPKQRTYTDQEFKRTIVSRLNKLEKMMEKLLPVDKTKEFMEEQELRSIVFKNKKTG